MSKLYVYSTLAADVAYTNHEQGGGDLPIELPPVLVKGGAGVMNDRLVTPRGVATEITEKQGEYLRANKLFQLHEKNGYVEISENYVDPEKAAADMTGRDVSAPLVPEGMATEDLPTAVGGEEVASDEPPAATTRAARKR